jgi:Ca2+-binding EF-hand superfamily protein
MASLHGKIRSLVVRYRLLANVLIAAALLAGGPAALAQGQKKAQAPQPASAQPLLRATFIAQMDAQFGKMDADKNGQLTRTEIEQFQKIVAVAEAQDRNRQLFAQLDADKSGQINRSEFAKLIAAPPPADAGPMLSREDSSRDGQVNLVEHRSATLANFDRIDTDKDGVVSVAEMKAGGISPR